ncbi:MAG: acetyl-CoA carboxylase biotin carboxyl carrier protein [Phycisphaera sp.]|nr:MAG: acetyl-CoA carboxylase biotin carboxyl carrier protein [Phycisphaera sp.]
MIDIRKLKELVKLMVENDLTELDLQDKEETVALRRGQPGTVLASQPVVHAAAPSAPAVPTAPAPASTDSAPSAPSDADDGMIAIESPMVGTFYPAPNPDSDPFVKVGDSISSDSVVCLVEAMKVFNEIKAEANGTIAKCLVESGQAVEFGQKLFLIKPN